MKIDMHCHVKEGSIDSKVGVEEYITILKKHGFQGMVITDHDTYNGYRYWKENIKGKKHTDFVTASECLLPGFPGWYRRFRSGPSCL